MHIWMPQFHKVTSQSVAAFSVSHQRHCNRCYFQVIHMQMKYFSVLPAFYMICKHNTFTCSSSLYFSPQSNRLLLLQPKLWQEKLSWVDELWTILTLSSLFHTLLRVPLFPRSILRFLLSCCQQLSIHFRNSVSEFQKLASFQLNKKHFFISGTIRNFNFSINFDIIPCPNTYCHKFFI